MCDASCHHVRMYREENGLDSYSILHAYFVSCIAEDSLKRKARECLCRFEACRKYQRVHACLTCKYFGCFNERHIHEHARKSNHLLAVDTNYGYVYCFECLDYQYDVEFERIARMQQLIAARKKGIPVKLEPTSEELTLIKGQPMRNVANIGLRGIENMGNTCYISVIIQSLVHAPIFRDYFLSLQHKCNFQKSEKSKPVCFACEISDIVQEFFCGKKEPIIPNRLLYLLWTCENQLKGYKMQDAHEFLFILLNNLHLNFEGSNGNTVSGHFCKCIIDTIFTGFSNYVYTCQNCSNVYSENIPFKDLVLISQASQKSDTNGDSSSLADCLRKTMNSVVDGAVCSFCKEKGTFNVEMTLKKLPLIISFHVNQLTNKKKFISFPEFLDMAPYTYSKKPLCNKEDKPQNCQSETSNKIFYLFAVVEHQGNEFAGHYISYVRRQTNWFSCNDRTVKQVKLDDVLQKKAYILFYHKEIMEYDDEKS